MAENYPVIVGVGQITNRSERLEESRAVVDEREEFESAETPVDEVEADASPEDRRRAVHERGKAAAEQMRRHNGE